VNITPAQIGQYLGIPNGIVFPLSIASGGTGANTAGGAMTNLLPGYIPGDCLSNSGGSLLWTPCGGGSVATFQANGTNLSNQTTINFENSAVTDGLTLEFLNPSLGNVQLGLTGILSIPGGGTGISTEPVSGQFLFGNSLSSPTQGTPSTANSGGSLSGSVSKYYYVVTAVNSLGQTLASNEQSVTLTPLSVPTNGALSQTSSGTLAATTYYVRSTWVTANGETTGATETSLAVSVNNVLIVAAPGSPPAGVTGWNVYVSTSTGTETKQNSSSIGTSTAWTEPSTGLISGSALPGTNTALSNTNSNTISWTAVTYATSYNVWRGTATGAESTYYAVSGGSTTTFTDIGSAGTSGTLPASNTTQGYVLQSVLPIASGGTGLSSLGTGVQTWLETPTLTNLNAAISA